MNKLIKSNFRIIPISLKAANEYITAHHRHNKKVTGHKFSIGIMGRESLVGVAVCGRPVARVLDDGGTLEVLRVCIKIQHQGMLVRISMLDVKRYGGPWAVNE